MSVCFIKLTAMTPLRQQMIAAMKQRGFAVRTHQTYLSAVEALAKHYHRSPEQLELAELQRYFDFLVQQRELSGASCRVYLHGIRFLYLHVLEWPSFDVKLIIPKKPQRIPELLTRQEVERLVASVSNIKHRTLLLTCYGCGLRLNELIHLKVKDIDGERQLLRVSQGKGGKDRLVIVSDGLLQALRRYWSLYHPTIWLFPNRDPRQPLHQQSAQRIYKKAKLTAGIDRIGGIHGLRHAYATHQLEAGLPVHQLQRLLGHGDLKSTLRYVHWVHNYREGREAVSDLVAKLETDHDPIH